MSLAPSAAAPHFEVDADADFNGLCPISRGGAFRSKRAGAISAATYFGIVTLLKVEEVVLLKGAVLAKLGKK